VRSIGVLVHPRRDATAMLECLAHWAERHGKPVRGLDDPGTHYPPSVERVADAEVAVNASLVIAMGGDGTILRAIKLATLHGVPVLGVNLGRLAFLAEVDLDELPAALDAIERDEFQVEERSTLSLDTAECCVDGLPAVGFNDAALTRVPGYGPLALAVEVEGEVFGRYTADALVVATPTGSTAYSFAAGGPIVSPRHQGLLVTPVAPHAAFDRAVFLHREEGLRVHVLERSAPVLIEVDGQRTAQLRPGDAVVLRVGERPARVMRFQQTGFYERARRKLQLVDSSELAPEAQRERV
jgi:NAD+ kinase